MPPLRLLHVSDLHAGTPEEPEVEADLVELVRRTEPEAVLVTGDLAHRNTREQQERAARLLRALETPLVVVPGNHDIPRWPPARFLRTFDEFRRQWPEVEPVYRSDTLFVVGLNSVRPWLHQSGRLRAAQLRAAAEHLEQAPASALRIVVLHHHLLGAPWRSRKKPVARRSKVLAALVDAGAELILAGHIHQATVSERHEFEVVRSDIRGVTVSIAPGLGQPRPDRRGEARGLLVYESDDDELSVETYIWREDDWGLSALRRFPRGRGPLAAQPTPT